VIRRLAIAVVTAITLAAGFSVPLASFGQTNQARRHQLSLIDDEIKRIRSDMESLAGQEQTTIKSIERLKMEYRLRLKEVERLGLEMDAAEERMGELEEESQALEVSLKGRRDQLGRILRKIYISGSQGMLRALLSVPQPREIGLAQSYLSAIADREMNFIEAFKSDIQSLRDQQDELRRTRSSIEILRRQEQEHSQEALRAKAGQERILDQIHSKRGVYDKALREKLEARKELQRLIEELTSAESEAAVSFAGFQGRLSWPCSGEVIAGFGQIRDQVYDVVLENDGIDIQTALGTPVSAVFDGKVIFSNWTDGRGNIVVIDHGNSYYSLYAHLDRFNVAAGDTVVAGQQIGTVGETGSLKGALLHFEIRRHSSALDPAAWLRKR
jgi:septal ring factor EnvC (AmiA/AmiB activator)